MNVIRNNNSVRLRFGSATAANAAQALKKVTANNLPVLVQNNASVGVFENCNQLEEVDLPNVTAVYNDMPSGITTLQPFQNCNALKTIRMNECEEIYAALNSNQLINGTLNIRNQNATLITDCQMAKLRAIWVFKNLSSGANQRNNAINN